YMADLKAFDVIDLDNDGELEMLVEGTTELDWARRLTYDGSSSASVPFDDNSIGLTGCDLRVGFFADVDGDGLIDLIRRPKKAVRGVCSGPASTDWVRNTGVAPYFDTTSPKPMMVPWERSPWDPHADPRWTAHLNDVASLDSCASGVVWPVSGHYSNSANYLADQANWLDVNQDGIVDLAFSGYSCWEDMGLLEVHRWQPVLNSAFSAVYLGTGYGGFIPTEIGAGMVRLAHERRGFTYQSGHIREVVGGLRPLDVDRSGKLSVLAPDTSSGHGGYGVGGAHWRGFLKGFGFRKPLDGVVYKDPSSGSDYDYDGNYNFSYAGAPGGGTLPAERGDGPNDFLPEGLGFMGNGAHCDPRFQRLAVGDFDGDGFQDLLTFSYVGGTYTATSGGTTITGTGRSIHGLCGANQWCVVLRKNKRTIAQGRLTASLGPAGGRTIYTYGFSSQTPHLNPDLPLSVEILEHEHGAEGEITYSYHGGVAVEGQFAGFATAYRTNARGATQIEQFALTPALIH
ncbi:MAG: hypothetical protein AAFX99_35765, partial [Myxococcota bacterium]